MMYKLTKYSLTLILICTLIFKLPQIHYNYVRNYVGNKVVKIMNKSNTGGGTGFHVQAPSGRTYIMTNSHVCSHTEDNGYVQVNDNFGNSIPRKILVNADFTDLCLVESMPGVRGLKLGSEPEAGDVVAVVGHPKLLPNTMSRGEIIGEAEIQVMDHIMESDDPNDCKLPKNKIDAINFFGLKIPVCTIVINAYLSNVITLPGNSGSPVVDFFGHVVGVVFAGDGDSNWGSFVTLKDVKKLLRAF